MPTPELNKALAAFQADLPPVSKNARADMGTFVNAYADLEAVYHAALPLLGKHGLAFTAVTTIRDDGHQAMVYALLHESGEERGGEILLPDKAPPQQVGSAITYWRRYCLCAVTGLAPGGEDDDGKAAGEAKPARVKRVRTAHGDPEHRALVRPTAAERARPADRSRGPVPEGENLWQDQPPPPGAGGKGKIPAIQMHFERLLGKDHDRSVRLGYVATLTGHAVTSTNDLTDDEQAGLLTLLGKCKNREALEAARKHADEGTQEATT